MSLIMTYILDLFLDAIASLELGNDCMSVGQSLINHFSNSEEYGYVLLNWVSH